MYFSIRTPVVFQQIESPVSILLRVLCLEIETANKALAGEGSRTAVNACLKAIGMNMIGKCFHVGKIPGR